MTSPQPVTPADVTWCYQTFLGRDPESEAVVQGHCAARSLRELVQNIYGSDECQRLRWKSSPTEVYRGYGFSDRQRLKGLARATAPVAGVYTDCFGQRFDPAYHPAIANWLGQTVDTLPLPDDRHLSEGIEYAAAALALTAAQGQPQFTAVELGAGFGPWTGFFGLVARHCGFPRVHLAAFEADAGRFSQQRRHLALNGLVPENANATGEDGSLSWRLFNAAAWWEDGSVFWPDGSDPFDAGMRAEPSNSEAHDYRGRAGGLIEIPALNVATALAPLPPIDIAHIDLQGSEAELIPRLLPFFNSHVRSMFIGTHSRQIEGDLITLLYAHHWILVREKPCRFSLASEVAQLAGRTTTDGAQYWVNTNPAIAFAHNPDWHLPMPLP